MTEIMDAYNPEVHIGLLKTSPSDILLIPNNKTVIDLINKPQETKDNIAQETSQEIFVLHLILQGVLSHTESSSEEEVEEKILAYTKGLEAIGYSLEEASNLIEI